MKAALLERIGVDTALDRAKKMAGFANKYGLLGLIHEWYSAPILPAGKSFVLPGAAMTKSGKLRKFNNDAKDIRETEGFARLQEAVRSHPDYSDYVLHPAAVARPSDLKFALKRARTAEKPNPAGFEPYPELGAWAEVRERFGALMLLDSTSGPWARVLTTRELADAWLFALPAYSDMPARLSSLEKQALARNLRNDLRGVSPFPSVGEDGEWTPGWMCPSLLQAMCLMLYYDLTGAVDIRRCEFCGNYFRTREGSRRAYCPPEGPSKQSKCASAASSRAYRKRKSRLESSN
jgi:hypothetical protein